MITLQEISLPEVSILIPTYNRGDLVGECIESALNQTFTDIEVIIVDNASTDSTWEICQEFAMRDPRVRIFRNETNIGPVRNWLRCVQEARGKYSKILFSDDIMTPDFIARTLPLLENNSVAFAYSAAYIGPSMETGGISYKNGPNTIFSIEEYLQLLVYWKVPYSPGAALFRTSDIRKNLHDTLPTCTHHDFWRHGAGPDVLLYALTAVDYQMVAEVKEPLVLFRDHAGSISTCNKNNEVKDGYRAALSWFFAKHDRNALWYEYLSKQWIRKLKSNRSWVSIGSFLIEHEGTGSIKQQITFMLKTLVLPVTRAYRKCVTWIRVQNHAPD